jgi:anti-sigma regulatory factor (Ser/Thr protein kinase)
MVNDHVSYAASDRSYFAMLRKGIHRQAMLASFSEKKLAQLDLIVAEITSNLAKHTIGGEILCGLVGEGEGQYLQLISIDNGPGITDLPAMLLDGVSSVSTLGHGLGSIKRLSDFFSIYTMKGWGTILLSRLYKTNPPKKIPLLSVNALVVPKPLETVSGDGCMYKSSERYFKLLLIDGLGHGPEANQVVVEASKNLKLCPYHEPDEIVRFLHQPLKKTRGGVGTVVVYDFKEQVAKILGVGNIATRLVDGTEVKNVMSYNGIIGHNIPSTMSSHIVQQKAFSYLMLCSDGIKTRWDLSKHPMILRYDPMIIAAAIYKDFARRNDDMSIIIIKVNKI